MEYTVVVVKPGFEDLEQDVLATIISHGYSSTRRAVTFSEELILAFYAGKEEFADILFPYYIGQTTTVFLIWGEGCLEVFDALKWRIRQERNITQKPRDGIHASDNAAEAERERTIFFTGQPCS